MNSHRRSLNTTRAKLYSPDTAESFLIDYRKIIDIGYFDQRQYSPFTF